MQCSYYNKYLYITSSEAMAQKKGELMVFNVTTIYLDKRNNFIF